MKGREEHVHAFSIIIILHRRISSCTGHPSVYVWSVSLNIFNKMTVHSKDWKHVTGIIMSLLKWISEIFWKLIFGLIIFKNSIVMEDRRRELIFGGRRSGLFLPCKMVIWSKKVQEILVYYFGKNQSYTGVKLNRNHDNQIQEVFLNLWISLIWLTSVCQ